MALAFGGQVSMHIPHRTQIPGSMKRVYLTTFAGAAFFPGGPTGRSVSDMALTGQRFWQAPQPMHASSSMTY